MAYLDFQSVTTTGFVSLDNGITGIEFLETPQGVFLLATSGINGGLSSYQLTYSNTAQVVDTTLFVPWMSTSASGGVSVVEVGSVTYALTGSVYASQMDGFIIDDTGDIASPASIAGIGSVIGGASALTAMTLATHDMLYLSVAGGSGISAYRLDDQVLYDAAASVTDTADSYASNIVDLGQTSIGGQTFLIAASSSENGLTSYLIDPVTGGLQLVGAMGALNGLGISNPTGMETISAYGRSFVVLASAGSNSLSVLEVTSSGSLVTVDHVIDTLSTRFSDVTAIESFTIDGRAFILAGGGDDGVSLFTLLPNGQLLHLETLVDTDGLGLSNIAEIAAHQIGQEVQVFITSQNEMGLTQFSFDISDLGSQILGGPTSETLNGGTLDDIINGGRGNDILRGNGGDDILVDGRGSDRLFGGAGADTFVLVADGQLDRIMDFQVGLDRLEISSFQMLYSPDQLDFTTTTYGARIVFRNEIIEIHSQTGDGLTLTQVFGTSFDGPDRPPLIVDQEQTGGNGDDHMVGTGGCDVLYGMSGNDNLAGGDGADLLVGGGGADTLFGGAGNDRLEGRTQNDRLFGGAGNDELFGGAGNDRLEGNRQNDRLFGGAGDDVLNGGWGNDRLLGGAGNDTLNGGRGSDRLLGGAGNDRLEGRAQHDRLFGGAGDDELLGGWGRDYLSGGQGSDELTGGGGSDTFVFSDGRDVITDFSDDIDTVVLNRAQLGIAGLTVQDVINQFATTINGYTALDFGNGDVLIFEGLTNRASLIDDILIY